MGPLDSKEDREDQHWQLPSAIEHPKSFILWRLDPSGQISSRPKTRVFSPLNGGGVVREIPGYVRETGWLVKYNSIWPDPWVVQIGWF